MAKAPYILLVDDDEDFLIRKFICGRMLQGSDRSQTALPLSEGGVLILADPEGSLPEAYKEGKNLCSFNR